MIGRRKTIIIKMIRQLFRELSKSYYTIGFVDGGMSSVMGKERLKADFIRWNVVDSEGSWFADPFILDVKEDVIEVLVEEMPAAIHKGVITKLTVDRHTWEVTGKKVILDLDHHLSFPFILRQNGEVLICPENGKSGPLKMYRYDAGRETAELCGVLCDDIVWDSAITDIFGERYMFTATKDDHTLDIYRWDAERKRFVAHQQVASRKNDSRLAGQPFEYGGKRYYPAQVCESRYGEAVEIKEVECKEDRFLVRPVKTLHSPHKTLRLGMHTLNEYKGEVVIDVRGFKHRVAGPVLYWIGYVILKLQGRTY